MSSTIIVSATTPPVTPSLANSAQQASNNSTVKLAATSLVSPAQPATNAKSTNTYGVTMKYRWVYFRDNIETAANLQKAEDVMARAVKVGYNGFVLSNTQMERLNTATTTYLNNLATLKSYADSLGMQLYPTVLTVGFANSMLSQNPNLIEGLPVKNALFTVHNGQATLTPDPAVSLPGGTFENATNNLFAGWDAQDFVGTRTFADTTTRHSGNQSLKVAPGGLVVYITKNVTVSPYRQYDLSYYLKTSSISSVSSLKPIITGGDGRTLYNSDFTTSATENWTRIDIAFNSLGNTQITIKLGDWGTSGTYWIDDACLNEVGLTNVIRRDECPLVVKGTDGTVYTEGVDFNYVSDPLLGEVPSAGYYDQYHASPAIVLTPNSSIQEGQQLRVSFFHAIVSTSGGAAISLTDPDAVNMFHDQLQEVDDKLHPAGFFINYDEIRAGNWEDRTTPITEGQLLAMSFKREKQAINQIDPNAGVFVWNDMFDPYHNAKNNFYYCNGTIDGSYNGLTSDVTVVNWNGFASRINSMKFFTNRGIPEILAGYYDGSISIKAWLADARANNAYVVGAMYTTWSYNYGQLEQFAIDAWGGTPSAKPPVNPAQLKK